VPQVRILPGPPNEVRISDPSHVSVQASHRRQSTFSPQSVRTSDIHAICDGVQFVAEQVAIPVQRHGGRGVPEYGLHALVRGSGGNGERRGRVTELVGHKAVQAGRDGGSVEVPASKALDPRGRLGPSREDEVVRPSICELDGQVVAQNRGMGTHLRAWDFGGPKIMWPFTSVMDSATSILPRSTSMRRRRSAAASPHRSPV
jgi:hypothetical protein